jgi:fatty-acyl-CoA synthase
MIAMSQSQMSQSQSSMLPESPRSPSLPDSPHWLHWPPGLPRTVSVPETDLYANVEISAWRWPDKPFIIFYDSILTFAQFKDECEALAGYLQGPCGVRAGDRVILFLQNSPQFIISFYAILRAGAIVVPVNPMNRAEELAHMVRDSGSTVAIVAQNLLTEVAPEVAPLSGQSLQHVVVACYSDYLKTPTDLNVPDFVSEPRVPLDQPWMHADTNTSSTTTFTAWSSALGADLRATERSSKPDDLCVMPYTSGTTGNPKGCMHTHRSVMHNAVVPLSWFGTHQDVVFLASLPFFHVTGMQGSMNGPLYLGATVVVLARWDREVALRCIERHRINALSMIAAMVVDFLAHPQLETFDLSSLQRINGGGAAMPEAVAGRLHQLLGLSYVEGYGMTETIAPTHLNPPHRPKRQCLGIPFVGVDSRVIDPTTLAECPQGETGEIVVHGPPIMQGYWNKPEANEESFITIDGKRFLRTGDLGRIDEDGYFFMVDRLKRMINASGFKVWPAEVESLLYAHPAIHEACIIAAPDPVRGETVKAVVVLRPAFVNTVDESAIIEWARAHMAAYKVPRQVEFMASLPKSGTGKVQWRLLQDRERDRTTTSLS